MVGETRFYKRFESFSRAYLSLRDVLTGKLGLELNPLEREGLIHRFKNTVDLGWKLMFDYLVQEGVFLEEITPKSVIRASFVAQIIESGNPWLELLTFKTYLSYNYDDETFVGVVDKIQEYYLDLMGDLYHRFLQLEELKKLS
ncbi:MAG: nucleotidyltransferase substrate binding protein [Deltaproteobacteria bacterium]|jgi:nucleotidyltransferase substrate binding protein (TIGR01987 family)|nr:nucleotidyltransferase substrate binding protein [Deltaproteobacteria bacterium]